MRISPGAGLAAAGALLAGLLTGCGAAPDVLPPGPVAAEAVAEVVASDAVVEVAGTAPRRGPFRHFARGEYRWRVLPVTAERLGSSHRAGCPVAPADLRLLRLSHWGFDGRLRSGELVVHATQATPVVEVFRRLHAERFPVERMVTVEQYGGDDDRSMAANNTSAYNCRTTTGGSGWSEHALGTALDINPAQNPYVRGTTVLPEAGRGFLDRRDVRPGMVTAGDAVVGAFAAAGWRWGGDFSTFKDYQHFSLSGR